MPLKHTYKTGRLKAERSPAFKSLETYATGPLPKPPATIEVPYQKENVNSHYLIDGNDRYGDCTIAGVDHLNTAWGKRVGVPYKKPTEASIVSQYFKLAGGVDSGLVEQDVLKTWYLKGLFGTKIAGFAPASIYSVLQWHQAIAFYGGLYLGIECPLSAQEQFEKGETWTYVENSPIEGGHAVVAIGYGPNGGLHCATWGGIAVLSAGFLAHYLDEAWVILSQQYVQHKGDDLGIDLAALQTDLAKF